MHKRVLSVRVFITMVFIAACFFGCGSPFRFADIGNGETTKVDAGMVCRVYSASQTATSLWEKLAPTGSEPQVRNGVASAYDANTDTLIVFGGTDQATSYNDVRILAHASAASGSPSWSSRQVSGTPPLPRAFALAAYSSTQDALYVFGGIDGSNQILSDLWQLSNVTDKAAVSTWTSLSIAGVGPSQIRGKMGSIYVEDSDSLVFFGGINCSPSQCTNFNDTYAITGLGSAPTWSQIVPAGGAPPGRHMHSSVYDANNDRMIVFGGNASTDLTTDPTANLDDVWLLSGIVTGSPSWSEVNIGGTARPDGLRGHSAVYDDATDRMIVFAGVNRNNTVTSDTWILAALDTNTSHWLRYDVGPAVPPSRAFQAAGYTGAMDNLMVIFGGGLGDNNYAHDTWVLHQANGTPTATVSSIKITAPTRTLCTASWQELTATAYDAEGNRIEGAIFIWSSSDQSIAVVDASGRVTAIASGTVTITVEDQSRTVSEEMTLTVTHDTLTTVVDAGSRVVDAGSSPMDCTCYCGWPEGQVCTTNTDCPPDTSVPGTSVPGVCGCLVGCN